MYTAAIDIDTPDGLCSAVIVRPGQIGSWPAVVLFPDAGSLRPGMVDLASSVAALGYAVLVPDIYYRSAPWAPFQLMTVFDDPPERARLDSLNDALSPAAITRDTQAMIGYLLADPHIGGDKIGVVGYCLGGKLSLWAAAGVPDRIGAAASFHGGSLATDAADSPHLGSRSITAEVYIGAAHNDPWFPPTQGTLLADSLSAAGVTHTLEYYSASHGFTVPDLPVHDQQASDRHLAALASLLARTLDI